MTMGDILDCIPPRPSEDFIGVSPGDGVEPVEVLVSVSVAASFMILVSGSFCPCIKMIGWLMFVPTVGITVAVIASMFGTGVNDLTPFVFIAVLLHDLLRYRW